MSSEKEKDKKILFVAKLIELTQDGKLHWQSCEPRPSLRKKSGISVDIAYLSKDKFDDKLLYLYSFTKSNPKYSLFPDASNKFELTISPFGNVYNDMFVTETILEIVDANLAALWTFSGISGLSDLYDAVRYQASGVNSVIDIVLGNKKEG